MLSLGIKLQDLATQVAVKILSPVAILMTKWPSSFRLFKVLDVPSFNSFWIIKSPKNIKFFSILFLVIFMAWSYVILITLQDKAKTLYPFEVYLFKTSLKLSGKVFSLHNSDIFSGEPLQKHKKLVSGIFFTIVDILCNLDSKSNLLIIPNS